MTELEDAVSAEDLAAPMGFAPVVALAPFGEHIGPIFEKADEGLYVRGFRVIERHCNRGGIAHGGMLTSFADMVLGTTVWRQSGTPTVTVRLVVDFAAAARVGDWVEGEAEVTRETRSLFFVEGRLCSRGRVLLSASGLFKAVNPRPRRG